MLNPFFRQHQGQTNESDLHQKMVTEVIQMGGVESWYIRRDTGVIDRVFNEASLSSFREKFCIEIYIENFEGFNGSDNDIISKFGLDLNDELKYTVSVERFREESNKNLAEPIHKPMEGDLIYLPLSDTLFEIKYSDKESDFYSLGTTKSYSVTAEIFDYSGEEFDTGLDELDSIDDDFLNNDDFANDVQERETSVFGTEDDDIVDFSEDSPFGTFGN